MQNTMMVFYMKKIKFISKGLQNTFIPFFSPLQQLQLQMPNSPTSANRLEYQLQNQIKKRINEGQPSRNDIEYYQRKLRRLESQFNSVADELSRTKLKLRKAEEFEYKFQLLLKQHTDLKADLDQKNSQVNTLQATSQRLKLNLEQKTAQHQDFSSQRATLLSELSKWKDKHQQLNQKSKQALQDERKRCQQTIKRQQHQLRHEYNQKQEDYVYEIRQLKKVIQQKETVEEIVHARVEKIRTEKDEEIQRLRQILEQKKQNFEEGLREKAEELEKMKEKFEKIINFDIENLKGNLEDQQEIFRIQLNGLREMIGLKNDQIQNLLKQMKRQAFQHEETRNELQREISLLKEKIYTVEKESEIEMNNLKQRLIAIHKQDIKSLRGNNEKIIEDMESEISDNKKYITELQRMRQNDKIEYDRMKNEMNDRLKEKDKRVSDLMTNLKQRGDLNAEQMKNLHQSFHQIASEKEIMQTEYQSNVTFLNQQIAKLNTSNQVKNAQIKKLHEQIHDLKINYEQHIRELQGKYRKDRKQREEERQQQRQQREKLKQNMEDLEREYKNKERRMEREKDKLEREKNKIGYMLEEAERDIQRLNRYIKQLDDNLKNQFKKNQLSTLDKDSLRREILSELEKQKVQLQAMKLMQIDQMKKKYEVEMLRLTNENEQLKTDFLNKSIAFENLESEFKKLDHKSRNFEKVQKEKIKQYEQKMMTLNQEINITQNLYKTFLEAKARAQA